MSIEMRMTFGWFWVADGRPQPFKGRTNSVANRAKGSIGRMEWLLLNGKGVFRIKFID